MSTTSSESTSSEMPGVRVTAPRTRSESLPVPLVLGRSSIDGLAWRPLGHLGDVRTKVLMQAPDGLAGLLHLEPGSAEKIHVHADAHHHGWVVRGAAVVGGVPVRAGSYFHIPAGAEHAITDVGPEGCEVFYVYQALR